MSFPSTWYHLTDRSRFKLDSKAAPRDAAVAVEDRSGRRGIYLAPDVEPWLNGYGYWRPFVVEFLVDPSVVNDRGVHGRWGNEMFVPASSFDKLLLRRVMPLDAYARELFGEPGWVESALGFAFDTGEKLPEWASARRALRGYRYVGPDVREMPSRAVSELKRQLRAALPTLR